MLPCAVVMAAVPAAVLPAVAAADQPAEVGLLGAAQEAELVEEPPF